MPDAELAAPTVENVRVVVRVRPMDQKETLENSYNCVSVDPVNHTVAVTRNNVTPPEPPRIYAYDAVFDSNVSQMDIYVQTANPIVEEVLKGYNGTIFAYGQTGTGKTYTMAGSNSAPELRGIIPNSFAHIFSHIARANDDEKFLVCVTYLEIYNEEVRDLLGNNPHQSLEVKERPDIGVFVKDLTGYVVHNADELEKIMAVGNKNRHIGATAMNTESSRSHAIFSITVESSKKGNDGKVHVKMGKLHLVDLAGSERQSKTQATGTRLKEATKINQSLSVLGNVISALVDGKSTHIPYRNSKLTRLLQDSLGGNSKTVMIATIGPAECNYVETISTLRYANRAKNIENKTHVNSEPGDALLTRFQQEIDQLKKQLEESANDVEEEEEEEITEEELSDDTLTEPEMDSLDPEEKKMRRKMRREEKEKLNREKAHQARKVLEEKKAELQRTKKQQEELKEKLQRLESKVLVGGENLLDKADAQRRLLEQAAYELEQRTLNELRLQKDLQKKEAERLDLEERYSSLQEENAAKTRKLKRAVQLLNSAKAELADQQREQQREMEGILDSVRALKREIQLADLVLDSYIPKEYQALIDQYVHWNEQLGEWQVKCVAYTGNNMTTPHLPPPAAAAAAAAVKYMEPPDLSDRYLSYAHVNNRPARPHTSVPRPHTATLRQRQ
ncbi:kinesin-like protein KIF3A isoform X3 [Ostrinia furnacalis]|uniref:kinesin-like protein KIF3A isoform X1 n=1 Tax=Ostrinia furnacalis TaxID=93504 RepID=UPI00103BC4C5|nr:kinesin-like protein KIF3A isoform X1 [Ostrinia furnacalis]XP_028167736.1 kinesin-like protein KIF3A isoform X2 [Ostrinia furnacalis]XP_028167737.1 kinesin-like protein KIF3A isoform X3 [Ostrinia furnacalis]